MFVNKCKLRGNDNCYIYNIFYQELEELRASSETYQLRIDHVDGPKDYDSLLRDKLQELREEFEDEAENAKEELEAAYRSKVNFAKFKIIALLF